jgi:hypothetical protein
MSIKVFKHFKKASKTRLRHHEDMVSIVILYQQQESPASKQSDAEAWLRLLLGVNCSSQSCHRNNVKETSQALRKKTVGLMPDWQLFPWRRSLLGAERKAVPSCERDEII